MSLLLLDTTFLVDAERSDDGLEESIGDDDDVAIAAITLAELAVGVQLSSGRRRDRRRSYVEALSDSLPVLPYDREVAAHHARLLTAVRRTGRPRGAHDLIIAATAVSSGRTVLSADQRAFAGLPGVTLLDHRRD